MSNDSPHMSLLTMTCFPLLGRLYSLSAALFGRHSTTLGSPPSLGLWCKSVFTFTASQEGLSRPPEPPLPQTWPPWLFLTKRDIPQPLYSHSILDSRGRSTWPRLQCFAAWLRWNLPLPWITFANILICHCFSFRNRKFLRPFPFTLCRMRQTGSCLEGLCPLLHFASSLSLSFSAQALATTLNSLVLFLLVKLHIFKFHFTLLSHFHCRPALEWQQSNKVNIRLS